MTTANETRVLLADVAGESRRAVAGLVRGLEHVRLVGEVADTTELAQALRGSRADVLLIDDRLLRAGGGPLPERADLRVIVLGVDDHPGFSARARRLGAEAWVAKERADDELPALLGA
jgi:DNA-binding NarL/FixJ family response regulator